MTRRRPPAEDGYALLAAILAIAVLALMSLTLIDTSRGITLGLLAETERARMQAAADAGLALAVVRLSERNPALRWSIDGRPRTLGFAGTDLQLSIEDERGKVPLNLLADEQARALFEELGATERVLDNQAESFLDWRDDDDERRSNGAEAEDYRRDGIVPRNGELHTVEELIRVRGMTADAVTRLRGKASVSRNQAGGFDERFAAPLALSVMSGGGPGSPAVIARERELAGQRVAIELGEGESLVGRPLTVRVVARRPGGGRLERAYLIELTGRREQPYVVRAIDAW